MENNEYINNNFQFKETKKSFNLLVLIIGFIVVLSGGTYAYFTYTDSANNISGNAGEINLELTVSKVLPNTNGVDDILIINFNELATSLNNSCADDEFALCQVYKVTLENKSRDVNTDVDGSISFDNANTPNLSWLLLGNSLDSNYISTDLGDTFNTASSSFQRFVGGYVLNAGDSIDYYIVVWVNEAEDIQTDEGGYFGTIKFNGKDGKGVTATFGGRG